MTEPITLPSKTRTCTPFHPFNQNKKQGAISLEEELELSLESNLYE